MIEYINSFITLYIDMAFYLMLGLIMVGFMKLFIGSNVISKYIGGNSLKSVVLASAIGIPLPLCSCGVLPTAIELKNRGAGVGATTSFLISTPQTGFDSIIATYGMMGLVMAIYRPIAAFISGIIGGIVTTFVSRDKEKKVVDSEHSCCTKPKQDDNECPHCKAQVEKNLTGFKKIKASFHYAFVNFVDDIAIHFLIGVAIAALIATIIPNDFFSNIGFDNNILAMFTMIVIGLPMYICSTSSIPIAIALILKGISPGAAFVFLFVGPVTNVASLLLLRKTLGLRETIIYVISVIVLAIGFGLILDAILNAFDLSLVLTSYDQLHSSISVIYMVVAIIFTFFVLVSIIRKIKDKVRARK